MIFSNKNAYYINKILTVIFFVIICFIAVYSFVFVPEYETYQISDWMINYQGGFVRRGLIGQILLLANHIHVYNFRYAVLIIELIFYVLFFFFTFKIFSKYNWSLLGAMFLIACSTTSIAVYRRDFMMLCLCYFVYKNFFKYIKNNNNTALILSLVIMLISIIIYEPVFFVMVPILILQYWNKNKNIIKTFSVFSIPLLCIILSCIYNGTKEQADIIWQSWLPYITQSGDFLNGNIGEAVRFLGLNNSEVLKMHFEINLGNDALLRITTLIIVFCLAFFLCTHIPSVNDKNKILECNKQKNELSKIVIFQLLIQLPLFIGLSCDYGRTIPMSIYTSFFLFHFSNEKGIKLNVTNIINKVSDKIMNIFNSHSIFSNAWVYIVLILVFPFHTFIPSLINDNIIIHSLDKIFKYIL